MKVANKISIDSIYCCYFLLVIEYFFNILFVKSLAIVQNSHKRPKNKLLKL